MEAVIIILTCSKKKLNKEYINNLTKVTRWKNQNLHQSLPAKSMYLSHLLNRENVTITHTQNKCIPQKGSIKQKRCKAQLKW